MFDNDRYDDTDQPGEDPDPIEAAGFTIPSEPPKRERPQRRSWWADVFKEGRAHPGEWRLLIMAFAESTARQVCSDVRNSYKRSPEKMRLRGMLTGERWSAECALAPPLFSDEIPASEPYWVWVRFDGQA